MGGSIVSETLTAENNIIQSGFHDCSREAYLKNRDTSNMGPICFNYNFLFLQICQYVTITVLH
jgi:hypothetical protein